ncbi:helix-turn-helix transcriptional regulator [Rubritalea spongiae]|uniref:Helix-turn-helix transcriptional regulator n=1 Tax=Rubritalea spongiae TaxID=430797 RepID=A0ABW5E5W9_9BACT
MCEAQVPEGVVRKMIALVGDTAAVSHSRDIAGTRAFLLNGLRGLIDADAWAWALSRMRPDGEGVVSSLLGQQEGLSARSLARISEAVENPEIAAMNRRFSKQILEGQSSVTLHRDQLDPDGVMDPKGELRKLVTATGVDAVIHSGHPLDDECYSHIIIYRRSGRAQFTDLQSKVAHIVLSEVKWLHAQGWPEDRGVQLPKLSPRERNVMHLLQEGKSRKEIADILEISVGTVAGYTKGVYKHFSVKSHAELIRKFSGR